VVSFFSELKDLPKECSTVIELSGDFGRIFDRQDISGQSVSFQPDIFVNVNPLDLSVKLANIQLELLSSANALPTMITFLKMFNAGKVEHLNVIERWRQSNPTRSLEASVGVNALGDAFKLDLHEKFHGPHGLIAGMTGSGKSEFIITYILSMAISYHPYEVAFILIDYKGGGMAKAFETLPHTAGIITNLDGAAVRRSLVSIESELKRRQKIFAEASRQIGGSNIDIYRYQKLFREGVVSEPLQHLFIIADEFAELKVQQPDFMMQLISTARIGRSLGIHLVLATQKPSGVVDDQIWSNSRFKVCLKVQDRADSIDMIKKPDAAELSNVGRFYLQVGYNELFELGQSAWAGAPYYPSDKVLAEKDNSVEVIDRNGRPIRQIKPLNKTSLFVDPNNQLDVITEYLESVAKNEGIKVRSLWLDPIPAKIYMEDLKKKYHTEMTGGYILNPVIGEYDNPARQEQSLLRLPISEGGNVVIYGMPGSGKITFMTAMIYSLITEHKPEEVNVYILDFSAETLSAFEKAPHVGDVILSHDEEKIANFFKMLYGEVEKRKKLFADFGGDYGSYIASSRQSLPSIVVAINNYAAFAEMYEEQESNIAYLSREGVRYGLYFILAAAGTNAVRFRMLQNFSQRLVLQLSDEGDYMTIIGKTEGLYPSKYKGRGLIKLDELYEFQVAYVTENEMPFGFIRTLCDRLTEKWAGYTAQRVPLLPDQVTTKFLMSYVQDRTSLKIPIGVEKNSLEVHYYDFGLSLVTLVLSAGSDHIGFASALAKLLSNACNLGVTVLDVPGTCKEKDLKIAYHSRIADVEAAINDFYVIAVQRNNVYKEAAEKGEATPKFERKIVIINSYSALREPISDESAEKLSLVLEKCESYYGLTIIIAETVKNISGFSFETWYKKHITQQDGIWIGDGLADQFQLKVSRRTSDAQDVTDAQFGFSVVNGNAALLKVLSLDQEER
jgi:S-DNA-T family DNA segregation ATPase FtsK/SpoIIIE